MIDREEVTWALGTLTWFAAGLAAGVLATLLILRGRR